MTSFWAPKYPPYRPELARAPHVFMAADVVFHLALFLPVREQLHLRRTCKRYLYDDPGQRLHGHILQWAAEQIGQGVLRVYGFVGPFDLFGVGAEQKCKDIVSSLDPKSRTWHGVRRAHALVEHAHMYIYRCNPTPFQLDEFDLTGVPNDDLALEMLYDFYERETHGWLPGHDAGTEAQALAQRMEAWCLRLHDPTRRMRWTQADFAAFLPTKARAHYTLICAGRALTWSFARLRTAERDVQRAFLSHNADCM